MSKISGERRRPPRRARIVVVLMLTATACAKDWPAFRHNTLRSGGQINATDLSNPAKVPTLAVRWTFAPTGAQAFRASPVVWKGRVYIGNGNGRFYALDANTGSVLWQYPSAASPALTSNFTCNPSSTGIASSAVIASVGGVDAVIFGAPDKSVGAGQGSGRLFALNAVTGAVIWTSPEIAVLNGTTGGSTSERHEQLGYSPPLVFGDKVYVGVADHCDNPIQRGRVAAVRLANGHAVGGFTYASTPVGSRGGGVWTHVAAGIDGALYVTTGNTRTCSPGPGCAEPSPNHGLSMLRLDQNTGAVVWKLQPVPWALDGDPDWSAGGAVMLASCGQLVASTMKDGWTYAVRVGSGSPGAPSVAWQFPATHIPFTAGDGTAHGDTRYMRPGAAWGDVFITRTGGENVVTNVSAGYGRLHALNACAASSDRVRWIIDVPGAVVGPGGAYSMGPPTVTRGIVYVGTGNGHLVAIADPSLSPASGWRCSNPEVTNADCVANGFHFVPIPAVLANVTLDGAILTEPVLANGRAYVATSAGKLYMLKP